MEGWLVEEAAGTQVDASARMRISTRATRIVREAFRVFRKQSPGTRLTWVHASDEVAKAIRRAVGRAEAG